MSLDEKHKILFFLFMRIKPRVKRDAQMAHHDYRRILTFGFPFEDLSRDVKLICLSNFIGAFGEGLYIFVLPLYLIQLQASIVDVGAFFSVMYLFSALAPIPGGFLADKFDRRMIVFFSWGLWTFTPLVYAFSNHWVEMIPGAILWGSSMLGAPAINAYIVTSAKDQRKTATLLASFTSTWALGYIFSPAIGGYLTTIIGMKQVLLIATVFAAVCTSVYLFISSQHAPKKTENKENQQPQPRREISSSARKRLLAWSIFYALLVFTMYVSRTFMAPFLRDTVHAEEFYIGLFGSINFAGFAILGLLVSRLGDRWEKIDAILVCVLMFALSTVAILFYPNPVFLLFVAFFWGGSIAYGALISSVIGAIAPETSRGRWISIPMSSSMVAAVIAPYVGGYLYEISPSIPFVVSLVVALPVTVLALTDLFKE
ncbi:MAG: MFS transporter [Candidatus Bathyarchaeia archaeon]|nr:MFS transporter [Candidatus Bathyarchaeota archaeon A05DMB-4]MDH7595999.1 MFS transporter [Candidatus Bathyarchaeota archaeon]